MTANFPRCAECRTTVAPGQNVVFRVDGRVQHVACPEVSCPVCSRPILRHDAIRRDGDTALHGNCWTRQQRAMQRRNGEPGRAAVIRARLNVGTLPRTAPLKTRGGRSSGGRVCDGCNESIAPGAFEYEVDFAGSPTIRMHRDCLDIWRIETGNGNGISGGSAASPWTLFFDVGIARRVGRGFHAELVAASRETLYEARERQRLSREVRERAAALRHWGGAVLLAGRDIRERAATQSAGRRRLLKPLQWLAQIDAK